MFQAESMACYKGAMDDFVLQGFVFLFIPGWFYVDGDILNTMDFFLDIIFDQMGYPVGFF